MELKLVEDFLSLASTRSFSQSVVERNITQSTLSRRLKSLGHVVEEAPRTSIWSPCANSA